MKLSLKEQTALSKEISTISHWRLFCKHENWSYAIGNRKNHQFL